jgi:lipopolysaccharide/colanic/teichoic acid biosynthesis glycosyltransferase
MVKRAFDIVFSLLGLIFLSPVFLAAAAAIKLDSSGPVFYRGKRTGLGGSSFYIYKFRTMKVNSEKRGGDTTALNDPRVTRAGKFLRKYKIDELPQLLNVLKGEMSIVGPRPELPVYTERYNDREKRILSVRPGITDHSSIELRHLDELVGQNAADKVFEERILPKKNELRLRYVDTRSFWTDLVIIFRTLAAIFSKK